MNSQRLRTILGTAAVTAVLALSALRIIPVGADAEAESRPPAILEAGDVRITVALERESCAALKKPVAVLTARNRGNRNASPEVALTVTARQPMSPMSRVLVLPKKLWSDSCAIASLAPGEVRQIRVQTGAPVPEGHTVSLTASCAGAAATVSSGTPGEDGLQPALSIVRQASVTRE